ncbi:unnamed protein product [Ranitomeya imitator]|uniref:Plexin cytoplasmic RhoGTPase-binding domain-containing protein n=1 Tax=Ranitomeya imitator TaxID=111125 RepID=A0ABN9LFI0_9NEOB|nr:unnamed protein product [Ranitomeya imitator]
MVVDDEEKANILNIFFSTVFTMENEMLGEIPRNNENPILRVTNLTQEEVRNRLNKIKIDKSPGPDGIHPRVLRELTTGSVPQDWRIANVVPIFKKGSKSEPRNYRPESVGEPLYNLVYTLNQRIHKGPIDAVTCKALYTLNEDWLLWQITEFSSVEINVQFPKPAEHEDDDNCQCIKVTVLDCDTIGQVKEKILQSFQAEKGYSFEHPFSDIGLAPGVSFRRLHLPGVSALTDQAEGAAHTICVIAPSDLNSQSADAGKMEAPAGKMERRSAAGTRTVRALLVLTLKCLNSLTHGLAVGYD